MRAPAKAIAQRVPVIKAMNTRENHDECTGPPAIVANSEQIEAGLSFLGMASSEFIEDPGIGSLQNTDQTDSLEDGPFFGFDWTNLQNAFMGVFDGSIPFVNEGAAYIVGGDAGTGDVGIDLVQSRFSFDWSDVAGIENMT